MAELIGNMVLLAVVFIIFKSFMGKSESITTKARKVAQAIDDSLETQETIRIKKVNPERYCNSADFLSLAALCVHPSAETARKDIALSEEKAARLRTKLLQELSQR